MKKRKMEGRITSLIAAILMAFGLSFPSHAAVVYLPDVTTQMTKPAYWSDKVEAPDEVLVSPEEIKQVNDAVVAGRGTGVSDLASVQEGTFDGLKLRNQLRQAAQEDAEYCYDGLGAKYDSDDPVPAALDRDTAMTQIYGPMIENAYDSDATEEMPVLFAICTTRTNLLIFPSDKPLWDDPTDPDFDVKYNSAVRYGEPMIVRGKSDDDEYYHVTTKNLQGWIPAEAIAICKDKAEWLSAWQFPDEETLVVYDDKIYTEDSNYAPETANKKLHMGTCLRLAKEEDWTERIINRSAYNNYVVWMPVRDSSDGSYRSQLALISEHCKVRVGYMPLTTANILKVAFNQLGDAYGWGGMLGSNDCSGYVADVYKCFGLDMPRNSTTQRTSPVRSFDLSTLSDAEKAQVIKDLPPGAELIFSGHVMLYLGCEGDKLYVISSVSSVALNGKRIRVRGGVINTLDITRANGATWLHSLTTATIPYYKATPEDLAGAKVQAIPDAAYTGKAQTPDVLVTKDGETLRENVHYKLAYSDNINVGRATVTVSGMGNYTGTITASFKIVPSADKVTMTLSAPAFTYNGKVQKPSVTLKAGTKTLSASDYKITWPAGMKNVGSYKIKASLKGNYSGSKTATFAILPKGTTIKKVVKKKAAFKVVWNKQAKKMSAKRITGYQVQYGTNKNFTNGRETVIVKKYKKNSLLVKHLVPGKKYYIRIRTYMTIGSKTFCSPWSKVSVVKVK